MLQKKTQKFFIFGRAVAESKWSSYDFYIGSIDFIWDKIVKMFWWGLGGPTINCFVGVANVVDFFPQEFAKDQNCWRGCYQLFEDAAWLLALLNSSEAKGLGQSSFWKEKKNTWICRICIQLPAVCLQYYWVRKSYRSVLFSR